IPFSLTYLATSSRVRGEVNGAWPLRAATPRESRAVVLGAPLLPRLGSQIQPAAPKRGNVSTGHHWRGPYVHNGHKQPVRGQKDMWALDCVKTGLLDARSHSSACGGRGSRPDQVAPVAEDKLDYEGGGLSTETNWWG